MFKRFLIALGLAGSLAAPAASIHAAGPSCQYVLGFATLASMIPEQAGQCADNEFFNPQNGDEEQRTSTGGLLVWRKADNWTAFTDGYRTWINGPEGLQERLNTERLSWEPAAPPAPPAPAPAESPAPAAAPSTPSALPDTNGPLSAAQIAFVQVPTGAQPMSSLDSQAQVACYHMQEDWNALNTGALVSLHGDTSSCPYWAYLVAPPVKIIGHI
jgi:hypothetical protein